MQVTFICSFPYPVIGRKLAIKKFYCLIVIHIIHFCNDSQPFNTLGTKALFIYKLTYFQHTQQSILYFSYFCIVLTDKLSINIVY